MQIAPAPSGSAHGGKIGLPSQAGRLFAGQWRRLLISEGLLSQRVISAQDVGLLAVARLAGFRRGHLLRRRSAAGRARRAGRPGAGDGRTRQPVEKLRVGVRGKQANPPVAATSRAYRDNHRGSARAVGDEKVEIAEPEMIDVDNWLRVMVIA